MLEGQAFIFALSESGEWRRWSGPWSSRNRAEEVLRDEVAPKPGRAARFRVIDALIRPYQTYDKATNTYRIIEGLTVLVPDHAALAAEADAA